MPVIPTDSVIKRASTLRETLNYHNYRYFVLDNPEIGDLEFDELFAELVQIEKDYPALVTPDSPTHRIGAPPSDKFEKIARRTKMYSIDKAFTEEEIIQWMARVGKAVADPVYTLDVKLDGLAIELIYENGILVTAATRGDGLVGEIVTNQIRTIKNIPLTVEIKTPFKVRGEVVMPRFDFEKLNKIRVANGEEPWANPRNAAAGGVRQLDPKKTAARRLRFYAYSIHDVERVESQKAAWNLLSALNFQTTSNIARGKTLVNIDEIIGYLAYIKEKRPGLSCEIDGVVLKVDDYEHQEKLGFSSSYPKWALAYKFAAEQATTTVLGIDTQVGRTGALTPVARLEPVSVGGVVVSNATLHNVQELARKDVRVGDTVVVQRAGDVIPEVVRVILEERPPKTMPFMMPTECPACGSEVGKINHTDAILRCLNFNCVAQLKARLKHFVSRNAYDIVGFGVKLADQLVEEKVITSVGGIFHLTTEQLGKMDRMGKKSAEKLVDAIEARREIPFDRFLYGLGIPLLGKSASKFLANKFKSLEEIEALSIEQIMALDGFGFGIAQAVNRIGNDPYVVNLVDELFYSGVEILYPEETEPAGEALAGKKFVITGSMSEPRSAIKKLIEDNGGQVTGSISQKTDFLVYGENAGSKKAKAEGLGVTCITESELKAKI